MKRNELVKNILGTGKKKTLSTTEILSGLLGIVVIMTIFSVPGSAAVGDLLRTITTPVPALGGFPVATSVGFDGANLYYTNLDQTNLYKIDANGNLLATIPMTVGGSPLSPVTSLSWDSSRNKFWAASSGVLYLLDPSTGVAVSQFNSVAFDGLAWDASDDTLWFSADANPIVHHTTTGGVELAGSPFDSGITNSGIAAGLPVAGVSSLYLGSDGAGKIYKYAKPPVLANQLGVFASVGGRDENLACDSASFPGKNALWSKDAYNNKLFAYEVEIGTCVSPPPPPATNLGSIAGTKFNDLNSDGIRQATESGLASWTITLTNDTGATTKQNTAPDGSYNFTNLTDGNYTVGEVIQPGWIQTAPAVSKTGSATYIVSIKGGNAVIGKDFGNYKLGVINGEKFNDINGNGIKDTGDVGLANWQINITGTDTITNTPVSLSTHTDANGNYNFTNLTKGTYTVSEVIQPGWVETAPGVSTSGSVTYLVTIGDSGTVVNGKDFGNHFDIPTASCVKGPNPSGNIPVANGGQRPDGFYTLIATDLFDPAPQIFVKDTGSGTIFPTTPHGFANGTNIKYTQAPGATPSIKPFSGVVSWHITGTGDAAVYAVNSVGNPSPSVSCLVPPPPK